MAWHKHIGMAETREYEINNIRRGENSCENRERNRRTVAWQRKRRRQKQAEIALKNGDKQWLGEPIWRSAKEMWRNMKMKANGVMANAISMKINGVMA
jgi:hypothetical protein